MFWGQKQSKIFIKVGKSLTKTIKNQNQNQKAKFSNLSKIKTYLSL